MDVSSTALLIFDADCGMCTRFANSKFVSSARIRPVGSQLIERDADVCRAVRLRGIDPATFTQAMVLIGDNGVAIGAQAFNMILRRRGGWRAILGVVLAVPFVGRLEDSIYRFIAARRGRISTLLGASRCRVSPARPR